MSTTYDDAREKARAARQKLGAKLEAGDRKPPEIVRDDGCGAYYDSALAHYDAGDVALAQDQLKTAKAEYELGLSYEALGDACVELGSTL